MIAGHRPRCAAKQHRAWLTCCTWRGVAITHSLRYLSHKLTVSVLFRCTMEALASLVAGIFGAIIGSVIGARVAAAFQRHDRYLDSLTTAMSGITSNMREFGNAMIDFVRMRRNSVDGTEPWDRMLRAQTGINGHLMAVELLLDDDAKPLYDTLDEMLTACRDEALGWARTTPQKCSELLFLHDEKVRAQMKRLFRQVRKKNPMDLIEDESP